MGKSWLPESLVHEYANLIKQSKSLFTYQYSPKQHLNHLQLKSLCYFVSLLTKTPPNSVLYKHRADRWSLPWEVGLWDLAFLLVASCVFSNLDISTGRTDNLLSFSFPQHFSYVYNIQQSFGLLISFSVLSQLCFRVRMVPSQCNPSLFLHPLKALSIW